MVSETDKGFAHYFEPIYYHEEQQDQLLQVARERSAVVEEEIHLCGYFCIVTSKNECERYIGII